MVEEGEPAPDFTVPLAGGDAYNDLEQFTLSDALGDGPIVLAFFPAAFTGGCTEEMCTFRDSMADFEALDAQVYGISVDLPFAQNVWMQEHDLQFPMLSDWDHEVIHQYDVVLEEMYGSIEAAERSVFVLDAEGTVAYRWVRDDENPEFETFIDDVRDVVVDVVDETV
ncbi:peroxiredoxin [Salinadaptatus halalkaliphilus]|uniref:Peroxiredoxin n=1 Tax=Salinadaptatus halalkaliphilus TaxID=2419781 RepID=A0A4S3TP40_9EURY|nr:redoxin domain-containing protein [Salinadaptatus halalkaliphilus]THE65976.1 peroxiredoxin [Salinadaptatus halalkaliphilus]